MGCDLFWQPVYSAARLAGLTFGKHGVRLAPAMPVEAGDYIFETKLASVRRAFHNRVDGSEAPYVAYTGRYTPMQPVQDCVAVIDLRVAHPELLGGSIVTASVYVESSGVAAGAEVELSAVEVETVDKVLRLGADQGLVCGPGASLVFRVSF